MTRVPRKCSRALLVLTCALAPASAAFAQGGGIETITVDFGRVGFNTFATVAPALYYRPIDHFGARPGAVALGMGGANLARANGPLAVAWSPAGLGAVTELSIAADGGLNTASTSVSGYPSSLTIPQAPPLFVSSYEISQSSALRYGAIAAAVPFWDNGNQRLVGAFSWRRYNDTIAPESSVLDLVLEQGAALPVTIANERDERGAVEAFGPSFGLQLIPGLQAGVNVNLLTGRLRTSATTNVNTGGGGGVVPGIQRFTNSYRGFNLDFGARLTLGERAAVAATFTPSYDLEVTGGEFLSQAVGAPGAPNFRVLAKLAGYDLEIPSALSVGGEVKPLERLRVAVDYNSQKMSETVASYNGPVPGDTRNPVLPLQDASSLHFGAEYVLFRPTWGEIPVRVGFRTADLGFAQADSSDYTYVYSYQNPALTDEERRAITTFETMGVAFDGSPNGDAPDGTGFSFGISLKTSRIRYDLGADIFSYEYQQFYFDSPWDPVLNPNRLEGTRRQTDDKGEYLPPARTHPSLIDVDRTITTVRLSATCDFPDFF
jgi:hypothetical protein